jgi:hypothetical protein
MKNKFALAIVTCTVSLGFSQLLQARTLKSDMKTMSSTLKTISFQVSNPAKNADSEKLALDLVAATESAKNFIPDTVSTADEKQQYIKMMDDTLVIEQELVAAFHNNDTTKAIDMLNKLSASKKEGHRLFK